MSHDETSGIRDRPAPWIVAAAVLGVVIVGLWLWVDDQPARQPAEVGPGAGLSPTSPTLAPSPTPPGFTTSPEKPGAPRLVTAGQLGVGLVALEEMYVGPASVYTGRWQELAHEVNEVGEFFSDGHGGLVYQPPPLGEGSAGPIQRVVPGRAEPIELVAAGQPPVPRLLDVATEDGNVRVFYHEPRDPREPSGRLLSVTIEGSDTQIIRQEFPDSAAGRLRAVALSRQAFLAVLHRDATTTLHLGSPTGELRPLLEVAPSEAITGLDLDGAGTMGVAVIERRSPDGAPNAESARLLVVKPSRATITREVAIPLHAGVDERRITTDWISTDGHVVLVGRDRSGRALRPLVYDLQDNRWSVLDRRGAVKLAIGQAHDLE